MHVPLSYRNPLISPSYANLLKVKAGWRGCEKLVRLIIGSILSVSSHAQIIKSAGIFLNHYYLSFILFFPEYVFCAIVPEFNFKLASSSFANVH